MKGVWCLEDDKTGLPKTDKKLKCEQKVYNKSKKKYFFVYISNDFVYVWVLNHRNDLT